MKITIAESAVMEALWRRSPLTSEQIFAELGPETGWSETTVKTLLARLVAKKAIKAKRDGRRYLYRPSITRAAHVSAESRNLIDRLFDGQLSSLLLHFAQHEELSDEEISRLQRLIKGLKNER